MIASTLLRAAVPGDLDRLAELERLCFPDPWPIHLVGQELRNPGTLILVAEAGPEAGPQAPVAGYASFRQGGGEAELLRLAVDPAARRRGLARALIDAGLVRLRPAGVERCFLEVRPDNEPAIACYLAMGFRYAGRRPGYYRDGTDAMVYARTL
ncbi:MAG TPA: GNAT family N-acetyltransferase [Thermoanaerobaculia bacterium]|nr:GNAT family N-acetyltransferase [Thermoanaerobaculia bacterium]